MEERKPSDQAERIVVRLPDGMRDRIAKAAKANGRSVNSEIVALLKDHYPPDFEIDELLTILSSVMDSVNGNQNWREQRKTLMLWLRELRDRIEEERATT